MDLAAQREHALRILIERSEQGQPLHIDYVIDNECRRVFNLPPRPANSAPYVGWMQQSASTKAPVGRISKEGLEHIKRWEGLRTNAYKCPAGVWTIGYGHTRTAKPGMMISHLEAEQLLQDDLKDFERAVRSYVRVPLSQGQFDALVSFAFNVGTDAFRRSTLVKLLNQGRYNTAALQFSRWTYAGGKQLPGLVRRRNDEYGMFVDE